MIDPSLVDKICDNCGSSPQEYAIKSNAVGGGRLTRHRPLIALRCSNVTCSNHFAPPLGLGWLVSEEEFDE
jgi:hypothetical protein